MAQKRAALLEKRMRREKESQQKKMQQEAELEQKKEEARYVDTPGEEIHTHNPRSHRVERLFYHDVVLDFKQFHVVFFHFLFLSVFDSD